MSHPGTGFPISSPTDEQAAIACLSARLSRTRVFAAIAEHGSAQAALAANRRGGDGHGVEPEAVIAQCRRYQLAITTFFDGDFPAMLRHIPDPPLLLYVRGHVACLQQPCVAVVGARRCSRMGAELAGVLAAGLVQGGLTVVSGLARGIDAAAHNGALAAVRVGEPPNTVAVMGAGLSRIYPTAHTRLAQTLVDAGGALVSEYPPTTPPAKHRFPERNRLISGLSRGVVIVEAGDRSGSLITAGFALEQGREVMAVPGAIAPGLASGCHRLLRDGAALVENARDVLETLGFAGAASEPQRGESALPGPLATVLAAVEPAPTTLDELVGATGLAPEDLVVRLLELELAGFVQQLPQGYIRRPFSGSS